MNSVHDLGGMHGMGPILHKENEFVFQADWEGRVFGLLLTVAALGKFNGDEFRHAQERIDPVNYLTIPYYHRWLLATEALLRESGIFPTSTSSAEEVASRVLPASSVDAYLARSGSSRSRLPAEARFRPGDEIVARNINPIDHTRLPRYVRGNAGPSFKTTAYGSSPIPTLIAKVGTRNIFTE